MSARPSVFEDLLRTVKHRLEGRIILRGRLVPVTFLRPDPDRLKEERPVVVIRWLDTVRNRARDRREIVETVDLTASRGKREPAGIKFDLLYQFTLLTGNQLDDARGWGQLMEALEEIASREPPTETLGMPTQWRYDSYLRDEDNRNFLSAARYVITTEMPRPWLTTEGALVEQIDVRFYDRDLATLREQIVITDSA